MTEQAHSRTFSNSQTLLFIIILSFLSALILSVLASALSTPKEIARDLDRSKQMMIAAKILTHEGNFLLPDGKGGYFPARYVKEGILEPTDAKIMATNEQLLEVYRNRFEPLFVDGQGQLITLEKSGIDLNTYINDYRKGGYYRQPEKLLYEILPNPSLTESTAKGNPIGYVIPVNGYGLWDAIYGYLALGMDGDTVIGIAWYDQKETPGLGANITDEEWQKNFFGKKIFQPSANGKTDFKSAPLGITVVRGSVRDVLGNSSKAQSAVDGMAGATLTGNGVTDAYRDVLAAYRPFLINLHNKAIKSDNS